MKFLRLKNLSKIFFGKYHKDINFYYHKIFRRFIFKLNKKSVIEHESNVKKERGFLLDFSFDNYLTFHLRPKKSDNYNLTSTDVTEKKCAIVIQGPIGAMFDFLYETLKIYNKIFPDTLIIISTWDSENKEKISTLTGENVHVIFNKTLKYKSPGNTDPQIISTYNALTFAKTRGIEYCIKQRTDLRVNKNNLKTYLISLIKNFPLKKKNELIKSRIIITSLGTFKYRLFSPADYFLFGHIDDLIMYFDKESYLEGVSKYNFGDLPCFQNDTPVISEIFLCARYLTKIENKLEWNLDQWWLSLKKFYCVVDTSSLDLFWLKYDWEYEYRFTKNYSNPFTRTVEFSDWLTLYMENDHGWKKATKEHERFDKNMSIKNIRY
jgi:hypothetical protein|tara:strand:- start:1547 stop:2683 length:1137 start_codon:yes stop_codon:yes gene_type:complete